MRRAYIHDKVLAKAKRLVRDNRVERLEGGNFNIIGDHGTYNVVIGLTGIIACNCPGYRDKGNCSHSTAVSMVAKRRKRR